MPTCPIQKDKPTDYYLIVDPRPDGEIIGVIADVPISGSVRDYFGHSYDYVGAAPRRTNGQLDVDALKPGEFILQPGLIYRRESPRRRFNAARIVGILCDLLP